jgi:hypothetical protein
LLLLLLFAADAAICGVTGIVDAAPVDGYLAIANVGGPIQLYYLAFAVVVKVNPISRIMSYPSLCNPIMEVPLSSSVCY